MTQYAVHTLWSCRKENTIRIYLWALMFIELRRCVLRHKYRLCRGLPSSRWYATKHQRLHPPSLQPSPSPLNSRSPPPHLPRTAGHASAKLQMSYSCAAATVQVLGLFPIGRCSLKQCCWHVIIRLLPR